MKTASKIAHRINYLRSKGYFTDMFAVGFLAQLKASEDDPTKIEQSIRFFERAYGVSPDDALQDFTAAALKPTHPAD